MIKVLLILLKILGVLGLILLALLVLLALLMCVRAGIEAEKNESGLRVRLQYGLLRFKVYPLPEALQKRLKKTPEKAAPQPEPEPTGGGIHLSRLDIGDTIHLVLTMLEELRNTLHISVLRLEMTVATPDAARTGMLYGGIMAIAGMVLPFLEQNFVIKDCRVVVSADFDRKEIVWAGKFACGVRPICVLWVLLRHMRELYHIYRQIQKEEAKEV